MKRIVFGGILIIAGVLGATILAAGTMTNNMYGNLYFYTALDMYDLLPQFHFFIVVSVIGAGISIFGLFDKR